MKLAQTFIKLFWTLLLWSQGASSQQYLRGLTPADDNVDGNDSNAVDTRIIGGTPVNMAEENRYPYYGMMFSQSLCGSVLITPSIAISVAHCQYTANQIFVGRQSWAWDPSFEAIPIKSKTVHPNFVDNGSYVDDIVVHHLEFASTKQYLKLNSDTTVPSNRQRLTTMGLGDTIAGPGFNFGGVLNEVSVRYIQQRLCTSAYGQTYITDGMMCAADTNKDACTGDSGGPLVAKGSNASEDILVGLVSWGRECADAAYPGVYTRISHYYDWIVEQVCLLSPNDAPAYMGCTPTTTRAIEPPVVQKETVWRGWNPSTLPLNECEGDCDSDADCAGTLVCKQPFTTTSSTGAHRIEWTSLCSKSDDADEVVPKAEYGVSYIGGDPCGSKYNDDPFDTQVKRPGMPDDMKARIQALVDKKVAEEKAAEEKLESDSE